MFHVWSIFHWRAVWLSSRESLFWPLVLLTLYKSHSQSYSVLSNGCNLNCLCFNSNNSSWVLSLLLFNSLTKLFQQLLSSSQLLLDWTNANVVPVDKKGDKQLTTNYRPISLTRIVVKTIERIIHCQLVYGLGNHKLLTEFGFRYKYSIVLFCCRLYMIGLVLLNAETLPIAYF